MRTAILLLISLFFTQTWAAEAIKVVDQSGQPIVGATALIGMGTDDPFPGNVFTTDENGHIELDQKWAQSLPINISAPGYVAQTIVNPNAGTQTVHLNKSYAKTELEISGLTKGYGRLRSDGLVDFSLIIPALSRKQMVNFDITSVVSPVNDSFEVFGRKVSVPSNISLPKQRETYILPVTLEKLKYRMFVPQPGFYKMLALHGRFPLEEVIDEFRAGKTVFEVLQLFKFLGGGQKDVNVTRNTANQDISVKEVSFSKQISVEAPSLPNNFEMVSLGLVKQGESFYPTDVKRVMSQKTVDLKYPSAQKETYALSALIHRDIASRKATNSSYGTFSVTDLIDLDSILGQTNKTQASIAFEKADTQKAVSFLPLVASPKVNQKSLGLEIPTTVSDVEPVATYAVLSEIVSQGNKSITKKVRVWEVLTHSWVNSLPLPDTKIKLDPNKKYSWEIMYLGKSASSLDIQSGNIFDNVTHITRSATDL